MSWARPSSLNLSTGVASVRSVNSLQRSSTGKMSCRDHCPKWYQSPGSSVIGKAPMLQVRRFTSAGCILLLV
eukprot:3346038-Pleurochrysis_carterae.AAC.1